MEDDRTIWCGNLSDEVTEEILYELFLQVAPLQRVNIPQDKEGRKSNYAFIVFKHSESVLYAVQLLNGTTIFNKSLNIKPRSKNQVNDNQNQFNFRDRFEKPLHDMQRRHDPNQFNTHSEPYFENLFQMGHNMMNVAAGQPIYSSTIDRRPIHFTDSRNNRHHHRDERKPYSRNHQKFGRHHNQRNNYEKQRHY